MPEPANQEPKGPLAREIAGMVNEARLSTAVELQISVEGEAKNVSTAAALEYAITLSAALIGACMRLAADVDDMRARLEAIEHGEGPAVTGTKE